MNIVAEGVAFNAKEKGDDYRPTRPISDAIRLGKRIDESVMCVRRHVV